MEKREPPSYSSRADRHANGRSSDQKSTSTPAPTPAESQDGGSTSAVDSAFQSKFASLSLHRSDRIRLLDFPEPAIELIRQAIRSAWPAGIQDEAPDTATGSVEFKLKGYPWLGRGEEAMHARRLMRRIFEALFDAGWILSLSTNVSKKNKDKDTLVFRHQSPPPAARDWISISFSKRDRLRVMDAPAELLEAVWEGIRDVAQERVAHPMPEVWEVKLQGSPWYTMKEQDVVNARRLLLRLFALLEAHGFTVYASIDQKADMDREKGETDTWHCCRPRDWAAGAPVYHA